MKICILCFSGTGGTVNFANIFKTHLESLNHFVTLIRIKRDSSYNLNEYDLFGIGTPVYSYRAPRFLTRILNTIDFHEKPFFVFSTTGGQKGNTHWNLYKTIKPTAGLCIGEFSVAITTNIRSWMPKKRRIKPKYSISAYDTNLVKKFIEEIFNNLEYKIEKKPKRNILLSMFTSIVSYDLTMAVTAGYKILDKKKCTKCGLCANNICPSGAISLKSDGYPRIAQLICVGCNGCVNLCPVDAIWALSSKNHHQYKDFQKYIIGFENSRKKE